MTIRLLSFYKPMIIHYDRSPIFDGPIKASYGKYVRANGFFYVIKVNVDELRMLIAPISEIERGYEERQVVLTPVCESSQC